MNKIYVETLFSIKANKFLSRLIIFVFSLCCFIGLFTVSLFETVNKDAQMFKEKFVDSKYYNIVDNFRGDAEMQFKMSENRLLRLKTMYYQLNNNSNFKYYDIFYQGLDILNKLPDAKFLNGYQKGGETHIEGHTGKDKNGNDITYYRVNSVFVGEGIFDDFNLKMYEGSWFSKNDYNYDNVNNSCIANVVLGYEYKDYYKVGDIIDARPLWTNCDKLKVIGILSQNTLICDTNGDITNTDRHVYFPSYNSIEITEDDSSLISLYLCKTGGLLSSDLSSNEVQDIIIQISSEVNINPPFIVLGASNQPGFLLGIDINTLLNALKWISIFIIVFVCSIMSIFMIITIRRNLKYYSILSINGFTYKEIKIMIVLQPLLMCCWAFIFGSIISIIASYFSSMKNSMFGYLLMLVIIIFIVSVSSISAIYELKKHDLSTYLRKR